MAALSDDEKSMMPIITVMTAMYACFGIVAMVIFQHQMQSF
jgi:hypothetical protein